MLFSMSAIDNQKYEEVRKSLRSSFLKISGGEKLLKNDGEVIFNLTEQSLPAKTRKRLRMSRRKRRKARRNRINPRNTKNK